MKKPEKTLTIYQEVTKTRQTTHWDLDYMTTEQIDALLASARNRNLSKKRSRAVKIVVGLILATLIALGMLLSRDSPPQKRMPVFFSQ
ncbi:MAG TPA: hypothetical protein EYP90_13585 [Chromatiaceae bacterium]|nr:hypothetical protein [Chromatiaceae bacterium]